MTYKAINFGKKFELFREQWKPKVIAEMNDYQFEIVRLEGDFIWRNHNRIMIKGPYAAALLLARRETALKSTGVGDDGPLRSQGGPMKRIPGQ